MAGFITTYIETIMARFTISFALEVYAWRMNQQTFTPKKGHSNTEKCYLKATGQFDREKSHFNHAVVLDFSEGFTRFYIGLTKRPVYLVISTFVGLCVGGSKQKSVLYMP